MCPKEQFNVLCTKKDTTAKLWRKKSGYERWTGRGKWARENLHWTVRGQWDKVTFSNESQVMVGNNNPIYIWRKRDKAKSRDCVCPPSQGKLSIMVWGCITNHSVGTITAEDGTINRHKYIEILGDNLWPVIARHFPEQDCLFQDDNAPIHRAQDVRNYKEKNNITSLEWPAQSPDLWVMVFSSTLL